MPLPFCQIAVLTSFPRIVDVSYRAAHGVVIFQIEDDYDVSVNGMSVNRPAFIGLRGNLDLQFVEPRGSLHAIITLGAGLGRSGMVRCAGRTLRIHARPRRSRHRQYRHDSHLADGFRQT